VGDISYTPEFSHIDWFDDVDRVRAGEPNGFNGRFQTIESDLRRLSTVVEQIATEIDQLDAVPPPTPTRLVVSPLGLAVGSFDSDHRWVATDSGAVQAVPGKQPIGVVNLVLPDGVRLVSLRAAGQSDGVSLVTVALARVPYDAPSATRDVVGVDSDASTYDKTATVDDPVLAKVDNATFRYVIIADTGGPTPADRVRATVALIHVVYTAT
jgi:hypothetical protein